MPQSPHIRLSRFATGASTPHRGSRLAIWLAAPGLVALVLDPALWLWRSWTDPSYQSDGMIVAGVTAALLVASLISGGAPPDPRDRKRALVGLALTAAVRLVGRVLAVNTIGALALVVDVWAVATLLKVQRRPFALHPVVVALFFALALPIEHIAQRVLGHPLQLLAAGAADALLSPFFPDLVRQGVLLLHPSVELAIDLPCSGARGLVLLTVVGLGFWTCRAPGALGVCKGLIAIVLGAFVANTLRIIALFVGGAHGVPIIEEPWHSLLGAAVLAVGATPLLALALRAPARQPQRAPLGAWLGTSSGRPGSFTGAMPVSAALCVSIAGLAIAIAPEHPVDVSPPVESRSLPTSLGRFDGLDVPLLASEAAYYTQWGGFAQKRIYDDGRGDPVTALLVRTRSPLRHLHGPEACLTGSGHRVTRLGVVPRATPAVLYRSVAPDGQVFRIEASFVNDRGEWATSVSEVVWRWLEDPAPAWSLIERITPWPACETSPDRCREFEGSLYASLDLPVDTTR